MAARPVSDPAEDGTDALRADRDAWRQRAVEAEELAEQLAEELAGTRAELAEARTTQLSVFEDAEPAVGFGALAPDGSDRGALSVALGATGLVALLAALLSVFTGSVGLFTLLALAMAAALSYAAWNTRVVRVSVTVENGVVTYTHGDVTHRFDLSNPHTRVEVRGAPGDVDWAVRFLRRALDPVEIDASMVDPHEFMSRIRRYVKDA